MINWRKFFRICSLLIIMAGLLVLSGCDLYRVVSTTIVLLGIVFVLMLGIHDPGSKTEKPYDLIE